MSCAKQGRIDRSLEIGGNPGDFPHFANDFLGLLIDQGILGPRMVLAARRGFHLRLSFDFYPGERLMPADTSPP